MIIGWVCCWFGLRIVRYFLGFDEAIDQKRWAQQCQVGFRVAAVFILNFWVCFFHVDFIIFLGLWVWFVGWFGGEKRKEILNEFLHVYLLRKCNKRKENIDYFNFLGNLHALSWRTWRTCYFVLPKIMKRKKNLITLFNWFMFVIVFFVFVILC